jgi:hypothetical protein
LQGCIAFKELKRIGRRVIIIEGRRGDKWLDYYLEEHNHFKLESFKKLTKAKKISFLDIFWPPLKMIAFFVFSPILPKSKKAFMVYDSDEN